MFTFVLSLTFCFVFVVLCSPLAILRFNIYISALSGSTFLYFRFYFSFILQPMLPNSFLSIFLVSFLNLVLRLSIKDFAFNCYNIYVIWICISFWSCNNIYQKYKHYLQNFELFLFYCFFVFLLNYQSYVLCRICLFLVLIIICAFCPYYYIF